MNGNATTQVTDASDAFPVNFTRRSHTTVRITTITGNSTNIIPAPVATPLPPLNRRVTGHT